MKHKPKLVAFEISNRCNYAHLHPKCPAHYQKEPKFLPEYIVQDALRHMKNFEFDGTIYFSIYNEPLIDPRFIYFVEMAKYYCPNAKVELFTNGWNLSQRIVYILQNHGVDSFMVSAYSDEEFLRLSAIDYGQHINPTRPTQCMRMELDNRILIYDRDPNQTGPCIMPSIYAFVNHIGELVMCCYDWQYRTVIADLRKTQFDEALASETRNEICDNLLAGNRQLDPCRRCLNASPR